jgi:hypothetical protein
LPTASGVRTKFIFLPLPGEHSIEEANNGVTDGDLNRIADAVHLYSNLVPVPTPINRTVITIYGSSADIVGKTRGQIADMKIGYLRGILLLRKVSRDMNIGLIIRFAVRNAVQRTSRCADDELHRFRSEGSS